jgi:TolB protein
VVWQDDRGEDSDIYLLDLESMTTRVLTGGGDQTLAQISGTRVVWEDDRFGNAEIYVYDLATERERRVTDHPAEQIYPDIAGDFVAWVDFRNGEENIYVFDLSKGREAQVTFHQVLSSRQVTPDPDGESQRFPALSGSLLIWQDYVWNNHDVFVLDIPKDQRRRITNTAQITRLPDEQAFPDISGRRIVWQDVRTGNSDIFLFDLDGGS